MGDGDSLEPVTPALGTNLIVGASAAEAASVFGRYLPAADVVTYADFGQDLDLSLLGSLGLVAGAGLGEVLPPLLSLQSTRGRTAPRLLLGLSPDADAMDSLRRVLQEHPAIALVRVADTAPAVLLEVVPRRHQEGEVTADSLAQPDFLRDLEDQAYAERRPAPFAVPPGTAPQTPPGEASPGSVAPQETSPVDPAAASPSGRMRRLVRVAGGPRRLAAAGVVVFASVLAVLVPLVTVLGGATGVLVLLGLVTLAVLTALTGLLVGLYPTLPDRRDAGVPAPAPATPDPALQEVRQSVETAAERVLALSRLVARSQARPHPRTQAQSRADASDPLAPSPEEELVLRGARTLLRERPRHLLSWCSPDVTAVLNVTAERYLPATRLGSADAPGVGPVDLLVIDDARPESVARAATGLGSSSTVVVHSDTPGVVSWFEASPEFEVLSTDEDGLRLRLSRRSPAGA